MDPFQTILSQWKCAEEWGSNGQGMDCGADIVYEAWDRQLGRANATSHGLLGFQHENRKACSTQE